MSLQRICRWCIMQRNLNKPCGIYAKAEAKANNTSKSKQQFWKLSFDSLILKGLYFNRVASWMPQTFLLQLQLNWEIVISSLCLHLQWCPCSSSGYVVYCCSPAGSGRSWIWCESLMAFQSSGYTSLFPWQALDLQWHWLELVLSIKTNQTLLQGQVSEHYFFCSLRPEDWTTVSHMSRTSHF